MTTSAVDLWMDASYLQNFSYRRVVREDEQYPACVLSHLHKRAAIADRFGKHLDNLLGREIVVLGAVVDVQKIKREMRALRSDFNMVVAHVRSVSQRPEKSVLQNKYDTVCLDEMLLECVNQIKRYHVQYFGELD